jgi:hypothetical protein
MILTLKRMPSHPMGTFGVLMRDGMPWMTTCERPWIGNTKNESCIPPGTYECVPHASTKFGNTFKLIRVPNRTAILFHAGNTADETEGCILLGGGFGFVHGKPAVTSSRQAMKRFMGVVGDLDRFYINIEGLAEE